LEINTYPRRIKCRSNLGHIFQRTKCVLWAGKYGIHWKENGPKLLEHLGTQYEITSMFKPNAPLDNVAKVLRKLGNDFTKRDLITTSHITRLYIVLGSSSCHQNSTEGKFVKTCIARKLILHVTVKKRTLKSVPLN